uniref:Reverse transcriptase domain-containing protein n=1 Tax=Tanacetum cinerariifolium TaxID=118510 RepID=A0A6L2JV07_TANCI|nr:hypothetical protein [Tanacetum cinerariifolium]
MAQNIDFSGSDQIQTPQYPEVHSPSQEKSKEVSQAREDLMKSIETFLEKFNCIHFEEKPPILLQAWFKFFAIQYSNPENPNELFQKLLEDLKELAEYINSPSRDQHLCIHDNVDDLIEIALNTKLLSINSQRLDNKEQEVKNVVEQPAERGNFTPILSTKEPKYSPSMGYEHSNTTPKTESDEIIKSGFEELVPILSENKVNLEDKKECDVPIFENSPICDDHSKIFSDSKNDDDISVYDDFEDVEYVEASLPDPKIVNIVLREKLLSITRLISNIESLNDNPTSDRVLNSFESDNSLSDKFSLEFETFCDHTKETRSGITTTHADDSLPKYDSFCFEIEPDQERLINVMKSNISNDSSNNPLLEEADLFLASDNSIPSGIENSADVPEGDICFLEKLLIDDSILSHESFGSNFEDNPSVPRPPPEPPDEELDFKIDFGDEISVVRNTIVKFECIDARVKFDDKNNDYSYFMFVKVFSLLSAESEDTVFDPGISV